MRNSEAAFVFSSVMEFIHVWRIGHESSLTLECKDGKANINFQCNLGRPDHAHIQDGRPKKKKSATRILKNNARAARHQAATRPPPPPPRTVTSPPLTPPQETQHLPPGPHSSSPEREPEKKSPARSPPSATARQEDSHMDNVWQPSELDDTRAAEYATVPLSPGSPGILREADQHEDISSLPSPQLSSPRREPGRTEIPIECRSEDDSSLDIEKLRTTHSSGLPSRENVRTSVRLRDLSKKDKELYFSPPLTKSTPQRTFARPRDFSKKKKPRF